MSVWPEVREVKDPLSPAVAYTENDRTVIDVDEKLTGRERAAAVLAAWRAHEQGTAALLPVAFLVYAWDPIKRWATRYPGRAAAVGTAAGAVVVAGVLAIVVLDDRERPQAARPSVAPSMMASPPPTLWTVTPTGSPSAGSTQRPTSTAGAGNPRGPERRPTHDAPSPAESTTGKSPQPRVEPSPSQSPVPRSDVIQEPQPSVGEAAAQPPPALRSEPDVTHTPQTAQTSSAPYPEGPPGSDCHLLVDVDPILNVCIR